MNQLLQVFSRSECGQAVKETKAERHARGFKSWDQFVAMLFCQLADAQSLREITGGLSSCEGRLEQLGTKVPKRSTLAYANEHRPWELFQHIFYKTAERCRAELGHKTKFRFQNRLLSIDSSVVTLCSKMFPWATYSRQKGAVKLHFTLDHAGYLPEAMVITTRKILGADRVAPSQLCPGNDTDHGSWICGLRLVQPVESEWRDLCHSNQNRYALRD